MATSGLRPHVSDLVFHLYDRPVHPELFDSQVSRAVSCGDFEFTVRIMRTGHAMSWDSPRGHLTELAVAAEVPLPVHRSILHRKLRGEQCAKHCWAPGWSYQSSYQVEALPEEVYRHVHDEIVRDGLRRGMLHNFQPHHRMALAPLSYVTTERWTGKLVVSTFHTFPDEFTIVKTQSLIEQQS